MRTKNFCDTRSVLAAVVLLNVSFNVVGHQCSRWDFLKDVINDVSSVSAKLIAGLPLLIKPEVIEGQQTDNSIGPMTPKLVSECLRKGRELARESAKRGNHLIKSGFSLESCSPAMLHFFSSKLDPDVKKSVETSHELVAATKLLQLKVRTSGPNVTPNTFMSFLEKQVIKITDPAVCSSLAVICTKEKYRTIDGSCNNDKHPGWGRKGAPFTRIVSPRYGDGIYSMPLAKCGSPLPNPRVLSSRLFRDQPSSSRVLTHMNMQWGQFITHDLVSHVMEVTDEGGIQCCVGDGRDVLSSEYLNDKCIPIVVSQNDSFYQHYGVKCLNFVRSVTAPRDDCTLGHAEQMNTATSFLDGSPIYGSDKLLADQLRSRRGGRLKEESRPGCSRGYLPSVKDKTAVCDLKNISEPCYLAGDSRINQTPTLALLHTLLLREHNRVADILSGLNPHWSDEKVYQEARRVVIAEIQHITYQEWLPLNFGENYMRHHRITPSTFYSHDYNEEVNPGVINGFGAGAFRFLHTVVPDAIMTCAANYNSIYLHRLSDHYLNPRLLEYSPSSIDDLVRGIITLNSAEADPFCTEEITNLLFKSCNNWGMDLVAMDIQRGRDHGLASYNDYRETCGLTRAKSFQDLHKEMSQDRINALAKLYESVDDVDLFVGGAMEKDIEGSLLGPTFQCIVAEQFYRTRVGDKYFYDHGEMVHSLKPDQLKEIKKASMARLICDNTDVTLVQKYAFEMESDHNPRVSCKDRTKIAYVDLTAWKSNNPFD